MALEIDVLPVESSPDRVDANIAGVLLLVAIDDDINDGDDAGETSLSSSSRLSSTYSTASSPSS